MAGKVTLVGAGPGGLALMTVGGLKALEQAEVVVYDRLVDGEILARIPPAAERIDVGKRAGRHPVPQEEINRLLLERALAGRRVVRLKGGDSFLFGRGGEELEALARNGVAFEVIPGVTSALAAPACAGIPVTHRDCCASVHILTGHRRSGGALEINYGALRQLGGTMVFLMSVTTFGEIAAGLIGAGFNPKTPCAVVENGARPEQRRFTTALDGIAACIARERIHSPAVFVVGDVCALGDRFDWFSRLPLHGKRVLLPRAVWSKENRRAPIRDGTAGGDMPSRGEPACGEALRGEPLPHIGTAGGDMPSRGEPACGEALRGESLPHSGTADSDMPSRSRPACGEAADNDMPSRGEAACGEALRGEPLPHSGTADSDMPSRSGPACGETADGTMPSRSEPACGEAADNDMPSRSRPACGETADGEPLSRGETAAPELFANLASDDLADRLRSLGARVEVCASAYIEPTPFALPQPGETVALADALAVEALFRALESRRLDARALAGCRLACRPAAARALRAHGLRPDAVLPDSRHAETAAFPHGDRSAAETQVNRSADGVRSRPSPDAGDAGQAHVPQPQHADAASRRGAVLASAAHFRINPAADGARSCPSPDAGDVGQAHVPQPQHADAASRCGAVPASAAHFHNDPAADDARSCPSPDAGAAGQAQLPQPQHADAASRRGAVPASVAHFRINPAADGVRGRPSPDAGDAGQAHVPQPQHADAASRCGAVLASAAHFHNDPAADDARSCPSPDAGDVGQAHVPQPQHADAASRCGAVPASAAHFRINPAADGARSRLSPDAGDVGQAHVPQPQHADAASRRGAVPASVAHFRINPAADGARGCGAECAAPGADACGTVEERWILLTGARENAESGEPSLPAHHVEKRIAWREHPLPVGLDGAPELVAFASPDDARRFCAACEAPSHMTALCADDDTARCARAWGFRRAHVLDK